VFLFFINPSRTNPAGIAISINGVLKSGCPAYTKVVGERTSDVLKPASCRDSNADSFVNVGSFVATSSTCIQPNPALSTNNVEASKAALLLLAGTQLVKK
jgi:hypothetical protein